MIGYLVLAFFIYVLYQIWKGFYFLFREYFVLWNVAVGAREDRRNMSTKVRLHAYVCKTKLLDEVSVNELYTFLKGMLHTDVTINEFHKVLLDYKMALMCRERTDGSLRGVMLLSVDKKEKDGKPYTLIRLGLSFFQNYYRGGPLLYYILAYHVLKELFWHPQTPLYLTGKAFSYKSYVAFAHSVEQLYPRYDAETPPFEKSIIDEFAASVKSPSEVYDEETCVLKRERTAMKETIAPIVSEDLTDPHIRFFNTQNPDWQKGHQLIMLAKVTWMDLIQNIWKGICRARSARKTGLASRSDNPTTPKSPRSPSPSGRKRSPIMSRQFSFQSETASRYATLYSEMDVGGSHAQFRSLCESTSTIALERLYSEQHSFDVDVYDSLEL